MAKKNEQSVEQLAQTNISFSQASAEQPAQTSLPLSQLNEASVKSGGKWLVDAYCPFNDKYEYPWAKTVRTGETFICTLICVQDPTQYCQAHLKKTAANAAKHANASKSFKNGMRFAMSRIAFVEAKSAYVSAPLKNVVDLAKTKMDPVIKDQPSAAQPVPRSTVAGSSDLGANQCFDVIALVQEVGDTRPHANNRSSFVVKIFDGSMDKDLNKVKIIPLRIYFDTAANHTDTSDSATCWIKVATANENQLRNFFLDHQKDKTAVAFYCIIGAQDDQAKFSFRSAKNTFLAKAVGPKAEDLNKNVLLHSLRTEDAVSFELQTTQARDWSQEPGKETSCELLSRFARTATGIKDLDNGETIWQLNWVLPSEPEPGANLKTNDGTRLWFPLTIRDVSGPIVLYITEQAALKLVDVADAQEFEQLRSEGRLRFPVVASVKVWRKPAKASAAQPAENNSAESVHTNEFDSFIVDAAQQDREAPPTLLSTKFLRLQNNSVDNVLPARLDMVRKSEHYAMAIEYTTQIVPQELTNVASKATPGIRMLRPCTKGLALVSVSTRSKPFPAGDTGHKLVTKDVVDYLSPTSNAQKKYTLTSFCSLETVTDFKLDPPPREKSQPALITFTRVLESDDDSAEQPVTTLLVDTVQQLTPQQAEAFKPVLTKMIYFAALAGQISRKREQEAWTAEESPAKASTCRILGRSPTGPDLPDYDPSL